MLSLVFTSNGVVVGVILRSVGDMILSENQTNGGESRTLILLMTPSYDKVKTVLSELQAEAEE